MRTRLLVGLAAIAILGAGSLQARPMFSSAEREQGLLAGRGMGLATPAENNGYPGPRHVLDAAEQLHLSADQKAAIQTLVDQMTAEAIPAARRLLADEAALDKLFIDKTATLEAIQAASDRAAMSESAARVIHLKYHLATVKILTPDQIKAYSAMGSHPEGKAAPMADMPGMKHDMPGMRH